MCLAIPMRIMELDGAVALVETGGVSRRVRLDLLPEAGVGDYVLVHAGMAIARVDADEAERTLSLLRNMSFEV